MKVDEYEFKIEEKVEKKDEKPNTLRKKKGEGECECPKDIITEKKWENEW